MKTNLKGHEILDELDTSAPVRAEFDEREQENLVGAIEGPRT